MYDEQSWSQQTGCVQDFEGKFMVALTLHFVNESDGTGGTAPAESARLIGFLQEKFNPHNIYFTLACINIINDSYYFGDNRPALMSSPYVDAGSLNIFVMETVVGAGGGGLGNLGGNACWSSYDPDAKARIVCHEVGHCLGLLHTFQGTVNIGSGPATQPEYVNGLDCCNRGDRVCDTPADPYIDFSLSGAQGAQANCTWIQPTVLDPNGQPYPSPLLNNIMSYYRILTCPEDWSFTPGQGERMRFTVNTSATLLPTRRDMYLITDTANETIWTGNKYIDADVYVLPGAVLRITGANVYMAPGTRIIIEGGGAVKVRDHSHITVDQVPVSYCALGSNRAFWKGFEVRGQNTSEGYPGVLNVYESEISFAENAVYLTENGNSAGNEENFGHGRVFLSRTIFRNNKKALNLFIDNPFVQSTSDRTYRYHVWLCDFIIDEAFPEYQVFLNHVSLVNIGSVEMLGCRFSTLASGNNIPLSTAAIHALRTNLILQSHCYPGFPYENCPADRFTESRFSGFGTAIRLSSSHGSSIDKVLFENCYQSISAQASNNIAITDSRFVIPNISNPQRLALDLSSSTGYEVTGNTFGVDNPSNLSLTSTGILVANSGQEFNAISNNTFNGLRRGIEVVGNNRNNNMPFIGLGLYCNVHNNTVSGGASGSGPYDFYAFGATMAIVQGTLARPGGNRFSNNASPSGSDFNNFFSPEIEYWYNREGHPSEFPDNVVGVSARESQSDAACMDYLNAAPQPPNEVDVVFDEYVNWIDSWNGRIDGGNTPLLLDEVINTPASHFAPIRTKLFEYSPFLSSQVVNAALARTDALSQSLLKNLLRSNPDVLKLGDVKQEDVNAALGVGTFETMVAEPSIASSRTARTIMMEDIINSGNLAFSAVNRGVRLHYQDTIAASDMQEVRHALAAKGSFEAALQIADTYWQEGNSSAYFATIETIVGTYASIPDIKSLDEFESILQKQLIVGRFLQDFDADKLNKLITIGETCGNALIRHRIGGFLWAYYGIELSAIQAVRSHEGSDVHRSNKMPAQKKTFSDATFLKVSPNPHSGHSVTVELPVSTDKSPAPATYSIIGMDAQVCERGMWAATTQSAVLSTANLRPGIYFLVVQMGDTVVTGKLVKL